MSNTLRIVLLLSAILTAGWILKIVYKSKVKLGDAIFWICIAIMLVLLGIFPGIAYWCSDLLGIQAPVNFIFLFVLALVIVKLFTLSIKVSILEEKITVLSAELAMRNKKLEEAIDKKEHVRK